MNPEDFWKPQSLAFLTLMFSISFFVLGMTANCILGGHNDFFRFLSCFQNSLCVFYSELGKLTCSVI